ncbi:MAG: PAS domain-containing protein [Proteobacteria bacterium]|nr:PAS domain-containing protein [Pseudomonadota bacterium]
MISKGFSENRFARAADIGLDGLPDDGFARRVLQSAPTVIYVCDVQNGHSVFQNRPFAELLGHPQSPANEWRNLLHPDDERRFAAHREQLKAIAPGETLFCEFRLRDAGGQWRWFLRRDVLLSQDSTGKPLLVVGNAADITEQKGTEERIEILAGEMRHRAKNLVSLVEGIGRLSRPKGQPAIDAFIDSYMGRLKALLLTGDIVLSSHQRSAYLRAVLDTVLAPFQSESEPKRIALRGPAVLLPERTAGGIALAIHELATNALKYGALSAPAGQVSICWTLTPVEAGEEFAMEWRETGGPAVSPPQAEGFGGKVIRHSIAHEPKSRIGLDYLPEGLRCSFAFEIRNPA